MHHDGRWVPPRVQGGYQQVIYLAGELSHLVAGQSVKPFVHADQGWLVSLVKYSSAGSLMGSLSHGSLFIEGQIAKLM